MGRPRLFAIQRNHSSAYPGILQGPSAQVLVSGAVTQGERLLTAAALLAAVVFVTVGIERPVWLDEANSINIARHGLPGILDALRQENNLPLYYVLLSGWIHVFGESEIALRALSAVFYLTGCGVVFALGKRLAGQARGGWYSALFYACSPLAIRSAQNIRMYAMLGFLSALSLLLFLKVFADEDDSWRTYTLQLLVNIAGLLTHVWFAFVLAGQLAALIAQKRGQAARFLLRSAMAASVVALVWGRSIMAQSRNGATDWMPHLQLAVVVSAFTEYYGFFLAAPLFALGVLFYRRFEPQLKTKLVVTVFFVSIAIPLAVCIWKPIYWPGRYAMIALPAIAAVLGAMLSTALPRQVMAGVGLALLGIVLTEHVAHRNSVPEADLAPGQSDRTTARFLLEHASAGDAVVFTGLTRAAADYYFRQAHAENRFVEVSFPQEAATHLGWYDSNITAQRRPALEREAGTIADELHELVAQGRSVWVYDSFTRPVGDLLKTRLDTAVRLRHEYPLSGPFHSGLLEYGGPI